MTLFVQKIRWRQVRDLRDDGEEFIVNDFAVSLGDVLKLLSNICIVLMIIGRFDSIAHVDTIRCEDVDDGCFRILATLSPERNE